jgi:hypothetical protein
MNETTKRQMLEVLADDRRKWNWYSLDIALAIKGIVGIGNIARLASELAAEGLIVERPSETHPKGTYVITEKGRDFLLRKAD